LDDVAVTVSPGGVSELSRTSGEASCAAQPAPLQPRAVNFLLALMLDHSVHVIARHESLQFAVCPISR
jgi:hypothetical protein